MEWHWHTPRCLYSRKKAGTKDNSVYFILSVITVSGATVMCRTSDLGDLRVVLAVTSFRSTSLACRCRSSIEIPIRGVRARIRMQEAGTVVTLLIITVSKARRVRTTPTAGAQPSGYIISRFVISVTL